MLHGRGATLRARHGVRSERATKTSWPLLGGTVVLLLTVAVTTGLSQRRHVLTGFVDA